MTVVLYMEPGSVTGLNLEDPAWAGFAANVTAVNAVSRMATIRRPLESFQLIAQVTFTLGSSSYALRELSAAGDGSSIGRRMHFRCEGPRTGGCRPLEGPPA